MTLGDWVRENGDAGLAALMANWMITIVITLGADYKQLNLETEYNALLEYLRSPMEPEILESLQLLTTSSELYS